MNAPSRSVLILIASSIVLAACSGKMKGQKAAGLPTPPVERLDNKTPEEVLKIKYNKADLICQVFAFSGTVFSKTQSPLEEIKLDLLKVLDFKNVKIDRQWATAKGKLAIQLRVEELKVYGGTEHRELDGSTTRLFNTPQLEVSLVVEEVANMAMTALNSRQVYPGSIIEAVSRDLVTVSAELSNDPKKERDFRKVTCSIETEAKPAYKDQIIKSKE